MFCWNVIFIRSSPAAGCPAQWSRRGMFRQRQCLFLGVGHCEPSDTSNALSAQDITRPEWSPARQLGLRGLAGIVPQLALQHLADGIARQLRYDAKLLGQLVDRDLLRPEIIQQLLERERLV